jgi:hypothetical protein
MYKATILLAVLCGHETCSITSKDEQVDVKFSALGCLQSVDVGNVAGTLTMKMEVGCSSETSVTLLTCTRCRHPRAELISIVNHSESLKSVLNYKCMKIELSGQYFNLRKMKKKSSFIACTMKNFLECTEHLL